MCPDAEAYARYARERGPKRHIDCVRCGRRAESGHRGLRRTCWPAHHWRYPIGVRPSICTDPGYRPVIPALPTAAPPGSAEKVRVLELRAECGLELWHPLGAVRSLDHAEGPTYDAPCGTPLCSNGAVRATTPTAPAARAGAKRLAELTGNRGGTGHARRRRSRSAGPDCPPGRPCSRGQCGGK